MLANQRGGPPKIRHFFLFPDFGPFLWASPLLSGIFFPFLQSIFFPLVGICLQLHLGHRSLSICGEWKGSRLQGFLLERSKQLSPLLVSFSFRDTVSQGSCETALVAFTYITLCLEFTAISLLLNLPALAPSFYAQGTFCLRILSSANGLLGLVNPKFMLGFLLHPQQKL